MHLDNYADVPSTMLIVDSQHSFAVCSIYGTSKALLTAKVQSGDLLYIKNPQMVFTQMEFKGRMYSYQCMKVDELCNVLLNDGQPLLDIAATSTAATAATPTQV